MRFRTCGDSGVLVELADLDETLRVFAALRSSKAAGIPGSNTLDAVTQLIPAARTILISFDPLLASRADIIAACARWMFPPMCAGAREPLRFQ